MPRLALPTRGGIPKGFSRILINEFINCGSDVKFDCISITHMINIINITIELMFAGINMFLARLRLILARAQRGLK